MVSAVENQKGTGNRRQKQKAILREDIVVEQPSTFFFIANTVLIGLVIAVEGRQVNIGTCLVLQIVLVIGPEACMDDESGEAVLRSISLAPQSRPPQLRDNKSLIPGSPEHHRRISRRMIDECFSTQQRIEYEARVGLLDGRHRCRTLDIAGIGRAGFSKIGKVGIVPRTICVSVLVRNICCWRMREVIPEERYDLFLDKFTDWPAWQVGHDV